MSPHRPTGQPNNLFVPLPTALGTPLYSMQPQRRRTRDPLKSDNHSIRGAIAARGHHQSQCQLPQQSQNARAVVSARLDRSSSRVHRPWRLSMSDSSTPSSPRPSISRRLRIHLGTIRTHLEYNPLALSTLQPLGLLDKLSMLTTETLAPSTAIILDKLTLLPLLFHNRKVLLVVHESGRGPSGWKPPCCTYDAGATSERMRDMAGSSIEELMRAALRRTLGLRGERGEIVRALWAPVHVPCFGGLRLPGLGGQKDADGWVLGMGFEFGIGVEQGLGGGGEWPVWGGGAGAVRFMTWFGEEEVRCSAELDEVTREILMLAFQGLDRQERILHDIMGGLEHGGEE